MLLAVDSGNTRIKWALRDGSGAVADRGVVAAGRVGRLRKAAARATVCRVAHVGGAAREAALRKVLSACADLEMVRAERRACGVTNHYRPPEALGVDRWLALLAVFASRGGGTGTGAAMGTGRDNGKGGKGWVIVSAGTATTIDGLTAAGDFVGGFILPGLSSFPEALSRATALPPAALAGGMERMVETDGREQPPRATADAAAEGALRATTGAAREFRRCYLPGADLIVTGGGAGRLLTGLPGVRHMPDLTLRGLMLRHDARDGH